MYAFVDLYIFFLRNKFSIKFDNRRIDKIAAEYYHENTTSLPFYTHNFKFQEESSHISIQQIVQMKILDERVVSCIFLHTKIEVYKWSEAD